MQQININVLKPHPRNNEFFDDLSGEEFERLKNSIKDEKIYTDILVSPDLTIISGHQRVRAAKELGLTLVPIKIDEDLQDEDLKLRALISNNFGRRKNDPTKDRKALATYVELKGNSHGGNRKSKDQNGLLNLDEIAKELNMSKSNLKRALRIERNLTDSMKELLDSGEITKTFASDTIASLSAEEQEELISKLDVTERITQSKMQKYIDQIKELRENPPLPEDYEDNKKELRSLKNKLLTAEENLTTAKTKISQLKLKAELNQEDAEKFKKLKKDIEFLTKKKNDLSRQIESATELAGLTVSLQKTLENDLAPIKFKRCMEQLDQSDTAVRNLTEIVDLVNKWSMEMETILKNANNTIEI